MKRLFTYRLEFYWQAISLYAIALIAYALIRGLREGFSQGRLEVVLADPLILLLFTFVVGSSLMLLLSWLMKRTLEVGEDVLILRNRFRERVIQLTEIQRIGIGREKVIKVRGAYKLVKIRLKSRRRLLRIRTSSFHDEVDLVEALTQLKHRLDARGQS